MLVSESFYGIFSQTANRKNLRSLRNIPPEYDVEESPNEEQKQQKETPKPCPKQFANAGTQTEAQVQKLTVQDEADLPELLEQIQQMMNSMDFDSLATGYLQLCDIGDKAEELEPEQNECLDFAMEWDSFLDAPSFLGESHVPSSAGLWSSSEGYESDWDQLINSSTEGDVSMKKEIKYQEKETVVPKETDNPPDTAVTVMEPSKVPSMFELLDRFFRLVFRVAFNTVNFCLDMAPLK